MHIFALARLEARRSLVHATNTDCAGARAVCHGTSTWLHASGARTHGTDTGILATDQFVSHTVSTVTQRIETLSHGTSTSTIRDTTKTHTSNTLVQAAPVLALAGWSQKPPVGSTLDRTHPWAANLLAFWPLNEATGTTVTDLVSGRVLTFAAGAAAPTWQSSSLGPVLNFVATSSQHASAPFNYPTLSQITLACALTMTVSGVFYGEVFSWQSGNTELRVQGGADTPCFVVTPSISGLVAPLAKAGLPVDGIYHYMSGSYDSANANLYVDSAVAVQTAAAGVINTGDTVLNIGSRGGSQLFLDAKVLWLGVWSVGQPPAFHQALAADPNAIWQMVLPPPVTRTIVHSTNSVLLKHFANSPGYRSMFAIWLGGAARATMILNTIHTTDAKLVYGFTVTQRSDVLLLRPTALVTNTDTLPRGSFVWTYTTDVLLRATTTVAHRTDILPRATLIKSHDTSTQISRLVVIATSHTTDTDVKGALVKSHTTDVWIAMLEAGTQVHFSDADLKGAVTQVYTTDILVRRTRGLSHDTNTFIAFVLVNLQVHTTDTDLAGHVTKAHATDNLAYGTFTKSHASNTVPRLTSVQAHNTDLRVATLVTVLQSHTTDIDLAGHVTKAHTTDKLIYLTSTKSHASDTVSRLTSVQAHSTDLRIATLMVYSQAHTTDVSLGGFVIKSHKTGSMVYRTSTKVHTMDTYSVTAYTRTHKADSYLAYVASATFVQRDNWLGGFWINQYGTQGYSVFNPPSSTYQVMPPKVTFSLGGGDQAGAVYVPPTPYGTGTPYPPDTRFPQVPGQPTIYIVAAYYTLTTESFIVDLGDGKAHAISVFALDYTGYPIPRAHTVKVYNANSGVLLDQRKSGNYNTNSIYQTWNCRGKLRFDIVNTNVNGPDASISAFFIDPPITVWGKAHLTNSLRRRTSIKVHRTDCRFGHGVVIVNQTDVVVRGSFTKKHATDVRSRRVIVRAHATDSLNLMLPIRVHSTDTTLKGARRLPNYIDSLTRGTSIRGHDTSVYCCHSYLVSHQTDAVRVGSHTQAHTTSLLIVMPHWLAHSVDTLLLKVPAVAHDTSVSVASVNSQHHTTSTAIMSAPVSGRWATPRVGTRAPVQVVSKDRQSGSVYSVGFLLVAHDRITPVLGAAPTVKLLKSGASGWVTAVGAVTEITDGIKPSNGWYRLRLDPADCNVPGEVVLTATAPNADTTWLKFDVVAAPDTYAPVTLSLTERNAIADVTLTRAFASAASVAARSVIRAVQALWYWKTARTTPMTVSNDDGTVAWQANVIVDPTVPPIRGMTPKPPP